MDGVLFGLYWRYIGIERVQSKLIYDGIHIRLLLQE